MPVFLRYPATAGFIWLTVGLLFAASPAAAQSPTPIGVWLHANQRIQIEIEPCDDRLCAKIVWFQWPNDAQGLPLVDLKNRSRGKNA